MKKPKDPIKEHIKQVDNLIRLTKVYAPEDSRKEKVNKLKELKNYYKRSKR